MASGTLCVILTLETKSGRRQNLARSKFILFQRLFCLLCYTICQLEEKFHTNWNKGRKQISVALLSIFVTVFLDSLSPVDAILTLGGRYSLPAHMLSHGRKNTSKKNKELCQLILVILSGKDETFFLYIFYCFQCSICQGGNCIFIVYTFC